MMLRSLFFRNLRECSGLGDTQDGSTGSVISIVKHRNRWFLFRMISRRYKEKKKRQPPRHEKNLDQQKCDVCDDLISSLTTPSGIIPMSLIQIDDNKCISFMDSTCLTVKQSNTTTNVMDVRHGLKMDDSILSYLREVDSAFEKIILPNGDDIDDWREDYSNTSPFYTSEEMLQGISVLTMDPALLYSYSVIMDEYSSPSFCQSDSNQYNDVDDNNCYFDEKSTVPDRYYEV